MSNWDTESWRGQAACKEADPDLFFPAGTLARVRQMSEIAKRTCARCEVVSQCLEFAVATNQDTGVWGGTSEEERRKLKRARAASRREAS